MINALLAGDVWLAPSLYSNKCEIKQSLRKILKDSSLDIFVCNLEAPFKSKQVRPKRRALIYTEPMLLDSLKIADKNILTLANNHISDFGENGLLRTIDGCKEKGFMIVGAGVNINEARKPIIVETMNHKIAIMSYAETAPYVGSISATKQNAGIAPLEIDMVLEDIADIRERVDDIWIFLHWGKEFIRYPMPIQRTISRKLIKGGATMLIGHHPHVLLGNERICNAYVYYSLGNFIFPDIPLQDDCILEWDKISRKSIMVKVCFENGLLAIDRYDLVLNKSGLPEIRNPYREKNDIEKLSYVIANTNYDKRYPFYYISENIRDLYSRTKNIHKLLKDLLWKIRRM